MNEPTKTPVFFLVRRPGENAVSERAPLRRREERIDGIDFEDVVTIPIERRRVIIGLFRYDGRVHSQAVRQLGPEG